MITEEVAASTIVESVIRGQKIVRDADRNALYQMETKMLNRIVKRTAS